MTGNTWTTWCIASGTASTSGSNYTWQRWNDNSATSYADAGTTWIAWTEGTTGSTIVNFNTANAAVWKVWASGDGVQFKRWEPPQPTEAELAERVVQQERARVEAEQRRVEQAAAEERSSALLAEFLDAMQRDQIEKGGSFVVKSENGKTYRVKRGWSGNVEELNDAGQVVASYCIHPSDYVPNGDNMLAQKLMLETNEAEFLRIANRSPRAAR